LSVSTTTPTLFLKNSGVRPLGRGHPWVYAGAVTKVSGQPEPGQVVRLADKAGRFVAWAWYSPFSRIRARVLSLTLRAAFDSGWWRERLEMAWAGRRRLAEDPQTTAFRLVNAEADSLPGLIVDLYDKTAVLQVTTPGADLIKADVASWLGERLGLKSVFERGQAQARRLEGLAPAEGPLLGPEPPGPGGIKEGGLKFEVDLAQGQGTGWYLDQRLNRQIVAGYARQRKILDCFAYSGGFSAQALGAGAESAVLIDSSARALKQAQTNLKLNDLQARADVVQGNVFDVLRQYQADGRRFGLIILDPPPLAPGRSQAQKASRAYKDLNRLAFKLLAPGGLVATFSSSPGIGLSSFQEILIWAAREAGVRLQILACLGQPEDHPVLAGFPESEYLKGFVCRPFRS